MDNELKKMVTIDYGDGKTEEVELVTYLLSDDQLNNYIVYSKGEKSGTENDEVIYVSKIIKKDGKDIIEEIVNENEWYNVQTLLKKIANG
jgi:hypothetical protein